MNKPHKLNKVKNVNNVNKVTGCKRLVVASGLTALCALGPAVSAPTPAQACSFICRPVIIVPGGQSVHFPANAVAFRADDKANAASIADYGVSLRQVGSDAQVPASFVTLATGEVVFKPAARRILDPIAGLSGGVVRP